MTYERLGVDIIEDTGVTAVFSAYCRSDWPEELARRVRYAFALLGLADSYTAASGGAIAEVRHQIERLHDGAGLEAVRIHLREAADSVAKIGPDSSRAVLYRGLAESDWYCTGGFLTG